MTSQSPFEILIAGAGISGLTAAHVLLRERPELRVRIIEARPRAGGNIHTIREQGFLIEAGPDSFLRTKTEAAALCRELGLGDQLISPTEQGRRVLIAHRGQLVPMPAGMALAVPTRIGPMLSTPLLTLPGKIRVLGDLAVPRPRGALRDETVGSFLERHFGEEATENIAGPLLGGIFAGDIDELSILSTFPQLVELERRHGSLIRAFFAAERARAAQNNQNARLGAAADDPFYLPDWFDFIKWLYRQGRQAESPHQSLRSGIGQIIERLVADLPGDCLKLGVSLVGLERLSGAGATSRRPAQDRWRAHLADGSRPEGDAALLCVPADTAAAIVPDPVLASELAAVAHVATAAVFFALQGDRLPRPLDASGYMVPRSEGRAFASSWASTKWKERAPEGAALVRVSLGGARDPALVPSSSEQQLAELALQELERMIGPVGEPLFVRAFKHVRPQPLVGHASRLARIQARLADVPGLQFASSWFGGAGIPDCIRIATRAAETALAQLTR